ncbi:MAG: HAMP domain-containing sensor histidine kinase [bacterium]|jgi:signal transduction histidine kinase|nr:HAMP domain-containing sensor histidine kinase [bacterium]
MVIKVGAQQNPEMNPKNETRFDSLPFNLSQMEKMAAIGQLSSSVAHEMRNLLGMIRTAAYNIGRAIDSTEPTIHSNLEVITRSISRAREYIDNLLNLSRIPHETEQAEIVEIPRLVDNLLLLFYKELEWRHIELQREYPSLPPYQLDSHALQECLLNLILNAIQSMDEGGTLTLTIIPCQQGIQIEVRDTGCGIPTEDLEKIFDPFFTTKKNGQGTGLGLSIARSLARDLGGEITVWSRQGEGSRFCVVLPQLGMVSPLPS